jgi:hypothetical protein
MYLVYSVMGANGKVGSMLAVIDGKKIFGRRGMQSCHPALERAVAYG